MFFRVAFMLDEHIKISASIAEPGFVKQIREKLPQIRLDKTVFTDFQGFQGKSLSENLRFWFQARPQLFFNRRNSGTISRIEKE